MSYQRAFDFLVREISEGVDHQIRTFAKEIEAQGHKDTGKLIESIDKSITSILLSVIRGDVTAEDYGVYVDRGVKSSRVNYNPFVLLESGWARRKKPGLSAKELKSFVFAVWQKHKKEGIPTGNSRNFSRNGFRKNWIKRGIKEGKKEFNSNVRKALSNFANAIVIETFSSLKIS